MNQHKGHAKETASSSSGERVLHFKREDGFEFLVCIDSNSCSKISGIDGYVSSFFGNNLRVFTPCNITIYHNNNVSISFPMEKIDIVTKIIGKPEFVGGELPAITYEADSQ